MTTNTTNTKTVTTKIAATSLLLSSLMIGTAAVPAQAVEATTPEALETVSQVQAFTTPDTEYENIAADAFQSVPVEVDTKIVEAEAKAKAEAEAKAKADAEAEAAAAQARALPTQANPVNTTPTSNIPTGTGAAGLLAAARAQIGDIQDCTAMVERALRALGYSVGDLAPNQFGQYGTIIPASEAKAGDILMRGGHVAIYSGDGTNHSAVHGGWQGNQTVESIWDSNPAEYTVVRIS